MRIMFIAAIAFSASLLAFSAAEAACKGSNGRGWGSGKGSGKFTMSAADKQCSIGFVSFIDDKKKTQVPATQVKVTRAPKNGKIEVTQRGLVYTPNQGFKGSDRFCTSNKASSVKGTLSGCTTVIVQ